MAERDNNQDVRRSRSSDTESPKLSDLLDRGWKIFEEIDGTDEPLSSRAVQLKVKEGINMLVEASKMIAELSLFSRNEDLEEIATADLKYLLLPALSGALTMKQTSHDTRLDIVNTARVYFMDFLLRCKQYDVSQFELPKSASENDDASEHETSKAKVGGLANSFNVTTSNDSKEIMLQKCFISCGYMLAANKSGCGPVCLVV